MKLATLFVTFLIVGAQAKKENELVGVAPLSTPTKMSILDFHNEIRRKVANKAFESDETLPGAANMKKLIWKEELAGLAEKRLSACIAPTSESDCGLVQGFGLLGEVAFTQRIHSLNFDKSCKGALLYTTEMFRKKYPASFLNKTSVQKHIMDEGMKMLDASRTEFSYPRNCTEGKSCSQFTQLIWAETGFVGCAIGICQKPYENGWIVSFNLLCKYGPSGNRLESAGVMKPPYKSGEACSECPQDAPECQDGLCTGNPEMPCENLHLFNCDTFIDMNPGFCNPCSPFRRQALTECRKTCGLCNTYSQRRQNILTSP